MKYFNLYIRNYNLTGIRCSYVKTNGHDLGHISDDYLYGDPYYTITGLQEDKKTNYYTRNVYKVCYEYREGGRK